MVEIELVKNGVRIGQKIYRVGETIKAIDESGKVCREGKIEFKKYLDREECFDIFHLGFLVVGTEEYTLIDFLEDAKLNTWKVVKELSEEYQDRKEKINSKEKIHIKVYDNAIEINDKEGLMDLGNIILSGAEWEEIKQSIKEMFGKKIHKQKMEHIMKLKKSGELNNILNNIKNGN